MPTRGTTATATRGRTVEETAREHACALISLQLNLGIFHPPMPMTDDTTPATKADLLALSEDVVACTAEMLAAIAAVCHKIDAIGSQLQEQFQWISEWFTTVDRKLDT